MDIVEVEEIVFVLSGAKLHGEMCNILSDAYSKIMNIFPAIEEERTKSRSGIQAFCSLHIALENAQSIIQHCSHCSKIYLAITGDSLLMKFERAKCLLIDSLKNVEDIVPQSIGCQILDIVSELEGTVFTLNSTEKQVGDDIIALLYHGRRFDDSCSNNKEMECFRQAALKLGINSSKDTLMERKSLIRLLERARMEEDKQKESIVAYLLNLVKKYYSKSFGDLTDDNDSLISSPHSPTVQSGPVYQLSKISSFNFGPSLNFRPGENKLGLTPNPPEELRCPISLQLMYDPVIISSGHTYEKKCIEKWFHDGHNTCPKTQQELSQLFFTPNYCVKSLIASWCDKHGVHVPDGPPESVDLNYYRLALSDNESAESMSTGVKVVPLEDETQSIEDLGDNEAESAVTHEESKSYESETHGKFLRVLNGDGSLKDKCVVVEQVRHLLKDDEETRSNMGSCGFVEALVQFLKAAMSERDESGQEVGAMALFNIAVNNNRNKELMLSAGIVQLLEQMIPQPNSHSLVAALSLNLSCLEQAKAILGSSNKDIIPFLINLLLQQTADPQSKIDALHTIFNLSTCPSNIPNLLRSGIVSGLHTHLKQPHNHDWIEKSIAILVNLAARSSGKEAIISNESLIDELAIVLDEGEPVEQEQAAACLLIICNGNENCTEMVVQKGVIPSLVCISVNGTPRGKNKAHKLLMLFREQRKQEPAPPPAPQVSPQVMHNPPVEPEKPPEAEMEQKPLGKSASTRMLGRTITFFRRNRLNSARK